MVQSSMTSDSVTKARVACKALSKGLHMSHISSTMLQAVFKEILIGVKWSKDRMRVAALGRDCVPQGGRRDF